MLSMKNLSPIERYDRFRQRMVTRHPGVFGRVAKVTGIDDEAVPQPIRDILNETGETEDIAVSTLRQGRGALHQRTRIAKIAAYCADRFKGDFVEIGAHKGQTTALLGGVAEQYGRRVVVVDPWETGTQNCEGEEFDTFKENTAQVAHVVDVVRLSSLSREAKEEMLGRALSFAFVDGLHTYDACLSDILAVQHCHGIIAVDDIGVMRARNDAGDIFDLPPFKKRYGKKLRPALRRAAYLTNRTAIHHPHCREGYLLPLSPD